VGSLTARATPSIHFAEILLELESRELFAQAASSCDPLDLSLLSSEDYRHEALAPGCLPAFNLQISLMINQVFLF
jgi:hypothetical protein